MRTCAQQLDRRSVEVDSGGVINRHGERQRQVSPPGTELHDAIAPSWCGGCEKPADRAEISADLAGISRAKGIRPGKELVQVEVERLVRDGVVRVSSG